MKFKSRNLLIIICLSLVVCIFSSAVIIKTVYAGKDDKYKYLDTFSHALNIISNNYVEDVENKTLMYGAVKGMLNELDPYSTFMNPKEYQDFKMEAQGHFGGIGITVGMKDKVLTVIAPLEGTPAYKAGLKAGDKIIKIEDKSTHGITLNEAVDTLRGKPGTDVKITLYRKRTEKTFDVTLTRDIIVIKYVQHAMIGKDVGYIRLIMFNNNVSEDIRDAVDDLKANGAKSYIMDLRNNPGGFLGEAIKVSSIFLDRQLSIVYTKDRYGKENHYESRTLESKITKEPLIVLVDEGSASASEIFSGAMQDHKRGFLVGTKTFGKASVQSIIDLADGSAIKLTTAKYYTPNGRMIHGKGIEPDFTIEPVINDDEEKEIKNELDPETVNNKAIVKVDLEKDNQLKFAVDKLRTLMNGSK